ncbi:hypothetical protein ACLESD_17770 [Pyxidicoccus sp. 3LFB2]
MKIARPLLALSALLALSSCSGDSDTPCANAPIVINTMGPPESFQVGVEAALDVPAAQTLACGDIDESQVPESATATVYDPGNHVIPSEVQLNRNGTLASVRFTPRTTGRHHVLVAFAPVGSVRQVGAYVAGDWSGSPSATTLPLPRCTQLDRTTRGTWLCDGVALREPTGREVRLGTSSLPPDVAVSGNVVWVVGEGRVRRFVDTGTELELTGSLLLGTQAPVRVVQSRLASENELWLLDDQRLHRFTFSDTGVLASAGATVWTSGSEQALGTDGVLGLLVRDALAPDRVLVVRMKERPNSQACPYQLGPTGAFVPASAPCLTLPGMPVGLEEGVVWTRVGEPFQATGQTLRRWVLSGGVLAEQGSLVLDASVEGITTSLRPGFALPDIRLGTHVGAASVLPVGHPDESPLGLERLPAGTTVPRERRTISPRFYWEGDTRLNTGSTVVYERPAR